MCVLKSILKTREISSRFAQEVNFLLPRLLLDLSTLVNLNSSGAVEIRFYRPFSLWPMITKSTGQGQLYYIGKWCVYWNSYWRHKESVQVKIYSRSQFSTASTAARFIEVLWTSNPVEQSRFVFTGLLVYEPWLRVVNGPGRASLTHFYLAHGHNGLGIMGY